MRKIDLIKFMNSESSAAEQDRVREWLNASDANRAYFNRLRNLCILISLPEERASESDYEEFLARFPIGPRKKRISFSGRKRAVLFSSIAAAVLLLGLVLFIPGPADLSQSRSSVVAEAVSDVHADHTVKNTKAILSFYRLPDGSKVGLYPGASISYDREAFARTRDLTLRGEAFFEVAGDSLHPFRVLTVENFQIKVTGTKFFANAPAPESEEGFETWLLEGRIDVKSCCSEKEVRVNPGEMIQASGTDLVKVDDPVRKSRYLGSLNAYFHFDNTPMSEVLSRLGTYYGVVFECRSARIPSYTFTADLSGVPLKSALNLFRQTMNIQVVPDSRNSVIVLY